MKIFFNLIGSIKKTGLYVFEKINIFLAKYNINRNTVIGIFIIFFIAGGAFGYKGYKYMVHDAAFCGLCHAHDYAQDAWYEGAHYKSTTCHDCHHQSLYANVKGAFCMVFNPPKVGEIMHKIPKVEDKHCEKCHLPQPHGILLDILGPLDSYDINKIIKISETKGHRVHLSAKTRDPSEKIKWNTNLVAKETTEKQKGKHDTAIINCTDCHGSKHNRAHSFNATADNCKECHKSIRVTKQVNAHIHQNCMLCHFSDFLSIETINPYKHK